LHVRKGKGAGKEERKGKKGKGGNRAGLSIVPVVPWEGPSVARGPLPWYNQHNQPISCQIFTMLF